MSQTTSVIPNGGVRTCLICKKAKKPCLISADHFVAHLDEHEPSDWPGGMVGMLDAINASIEQSIVENEGYPRTQERLRKSQGYVMSMKALVERLPSDV
jgi:hypothetical protein